MGGLPLPGIPGLASQELLRHGLQAREGEARDPSGGRFGPRLPLGSTRAQDLRRWPHRPMEPDAGVKWLAGMGSPGRRCHRRPEWTARVLKLQFGVSDGYHAEPADHAGIAPEALVKETVGLRFRFADAALAVAEVS